MKKCPYCAEKIKDDAIKCKHCGEWLKDPNKDLIEKVDSDNPPPILEEDKPTQIPEEEKPNPIPDNVVSNTVEEPKDIPPDGDTQSTSVDLSEETDFSTIPIPEKKIGIGWGWFILLSSYYYALSKVSLYIRSEIGKGIFYLAIIILLIIVVILYFKIRRYFLKKKKLSSIWPVSLLTGIACFLVMSVIGGLSLGFIGRIDANIWMNLFNEQASKTNTELLKYNNEEEAIWEKINLDPINLEEEYETTKFISSLLNIINMREQMTQNYLDLYIKTYPNSSEKMESVRKTTSWVNSEYKKHLNSLLTSYITKNEKDKELAKEKLGELIIQASVLQKVLVKILNK